MKKIFVLSAMIFSFSFVPSIGMEEKEPLISQLLKKMPTALKRNLKTPSPGEEEILKKKVSNDKIALQNLSTILRGLPDGSMEKRSGGVGFEPYFSSNLFKETHFPQCCFNELGERDFLNISDVGLQLQVFEGANGRYLKQISESEYRKSLLVIMNYMINEGKFPPHLKSISIKDVV